eukprot:Ihof_evm4s32 gene=Ihof_evmTU4s32
METPYLGTPNSVTPEETEHRRQLLEEELESFVVTLGTLEDVLATNPDRLMDRMYVCGGVGVGGEGRGGGKGRRGEGLHVCLYLWINEINTHIMRLTEHNNVNLDVPVDMLRYLDTDRNPDLFIRDELTRTVMPTQVAKAKTVIYR